jgi:hypothetical protein
MTAAAPAIGPIHADLLGTLHPALVGPAALERAMAGPPSWCTAEILRAHGEALREAGDVGAARRLFIRAQDIARQQGALAWELRAATSLAAMDGPEDSLAGILAQFNEGGRTADHRRAMALLGGA